MHDFFMPIERFTMEDLFDGRMNQYGIQEKVVAGLTSASYRCLTTDSAFVWVKANHCVMYFVCGRKRPYFTILAAIAEAFDTVIYAEQFIDEPDYTLWGPVSVGRIAAWENETISSFKVQCDGIVNEWDESRPPSTLEKDVDTIRLLSDNVWDNTVSSKRDLASKEKTSEKKVWPTLRIDHAEHDYFF